MEIYLDNNHLNCVTSNPLFIKNVVSLLELVSPYFDILDKASNETLTNHITSLGDVCQKILLTKLGDSKTDLFNSTNYSNVFIGTYSEEFIEIMILVQKLWQISSKLDSYPTLELQDKGIRQKDKEIFVSNIKLLRNKLVLLESKIKKTESNDTLGNKQH